VVDEGIRHLHFESVNHARAFFTGEVVPLELDFMVGVVRAGLRASRDVNM
jgi:hypothetical protein